MKIIVTSAVLAFIISCSAYRKLPVLVDFPSWKTKEMLPSPQSMEGDPDSGFHYLIYGNYIGSGIPVDFFGKQLPFGNDKVLQREGTNSRLPYVTTAFEAANGVEVINGNCFTCHAGNINGTLMLGLGNSASDFTKNFNLAARAIDTGMKLKYSKKSPERNAYESFGNYFEAIGPYIRTDKIGVNPAARLAEACAMYRDPVDLSYTYEPLFSMPSYTLASDVPPLWNVKKKNALYYTAVGKGDFTKLLFQASVLGIPDTTAARNAVENFKHVLAWIYSLEPPKYPGKVNQLLADEGKVVFEKKCSSCHGTYGETPYYPNKVVSLNTIKTDPYYAYYAMEAPIVDWYNRSWFAQSEPKSKLDPEPGYMAPPLDGIWATAPYLHNGSIPDLEGVLNSKIRPTYWTRISGDKNYNFENIGIHYQPSDKSKGKWTYDTTLPGYSNRGHYFGDDLDENNRLAVIEYLKTL
jgi:mono/diheme cytochrome c family protein